MREFLESLLPNPPIHRRKQANEKAAWMPRCAVSLQDVCQNATISLLLTTRLLYFFTYCKKTKVNDGRISYREEIALVGYNMV